MGMFDKRERTKRAEKALEEEVKRLKLEAGAGFLLDPQSWRDMGANITGLGKAYASLDRPEEMSAGATMGDMGLGALPVVGTAQSLRDLERARREDDPVGMGVSAAGAGLGLLPMGGMFGAGLKRLTRREALEVVKKAKEPGFIGGTLPLDKMAQPERGYAVAPKTIGGARGAQTTFNAADLKASDIEKFVRDMRMTDKDALGLWVNEGKLYLDKSAVFPSRFRAINEGNANKQLAAWDLKRSKEIPLREEFEPARRAAIDLENRITSMPKPRSRPDAVIPGLWDHPRDIVARSSTLVAPEDPLLQRLFGVSRQDLDEMTLLAQDPAKANPRIYIPTRPPEYLEKVLTPSNASRVRNILEVASEDPKMGGMFGWHMTDPLLAKLKAGPQGAMKRFAPEWSEKDAIDAYLLHHKLGSAMSPMSDVAKEVDRASVAYTMAKEGRLLDFIDPRNLPTNYGHMAHSTAHAAGVKNIAKHGEFFGADPSPKTPNYYFSRLGENYYYPTGDAHFSRAMGLPDVRPLMRSKEGGLVKDMSSIGKTEAAPVGDWFARQVAGPLGMTGSPGQSLLWGAAAKDTGVESAIGAPYLEILASRIGKSAARQGIEPEEAFWRYFTGTGGMKSRLGYADPKLLGLAALGTAGAAAPFYKALEDERDVGPVRKLNPGRREDPNAMSMWENLVRYFTEDPRPDTRVTATRG